MDNRKIKDMLVADLFCLRATSEPDMMLFCDNECDACKWCYQKGKVGERKEMLKTLIKLIDSEYIKEITKENIKETAHKADYAKAFNMLTSDLGLDYYEDTGGIKVKYIRQSMARLSKNEE